MLKKRSKIIFERIEKLSEELSCVTEEDHKRIRNTEIKNILNDIYSVWKNCPELRFLQLISNVVDTNKDIYYISDNEFLHKLNKDFKNKYNKE